MQTNASIEGQKDLVIIASARQGQDLAELILLYGQYLQYISPKKDKAQFERLQDIKAQIIDQL